MSRSFSKIRLNRLNRAPQESSVRNPKLIPMTRPFLLASSKYGGTKPIARRSEARTPKISEGHATPSSFFLLTNGIQEASKATESPTKLEITAQVFFFDHFVGG